MSESTLRSELQQLLQMAQLPMSELQLQQLLAYVDLLHKWNKAYNLTAIKQPNEMLSKHILDSLVVGPFLEGQYFLDVGTGPGLPGIPLAIAYPNTQWLLIDSLGKRMRFLKQVIYELKIENVTILESRIEDVERKSIHFTSIDGILSRAFASLESMLSLTKHLADKNTVFYALKGPDYQQEQQVLQAWAQVDELVELSVPKLSAQRYLVKIKKKDM